MRRTINPDNIVESKRARKPKETWEPEDPRLVKRSRKVKNIGRNRNEATSDTLANKWNDYRQLIKKFVGGLLKEQHYLELYSQSQTLKEGDKELARIQSKVRTWKQAIIGTMKALESENAEHRRWPELGQADEEDMVEVSHILCSVCNKEETDDNDILFCDRAGCFRAYHQLCLQPPITLQDFDQSQDWFCWQCECLDDCLDLLSERLGEEYDSVANLFPEVQQEKEAELAAANTLAGAILGEDEDDDPDEEYNPTSEEIADEAEELEDASVAQEEDDNAMEEDTNDENCDKESGLFDRLQALSENIQGESDHPIEANEMDLDMDDEFDEEDEVSDVDSYLDEEEIAGLLEDAAGDLQDIPMLHNITDEPAVGEDEDGIGYRRKLRDRSKREGSQLVHVFGAEDVGRDIARVQRGVFITGTVTHFQLALPDPKVISETQDETVSSKNDEKMNSVEKEMLDTFHATSSQNESNNTRVSFTDDDIEQFGRWTLSYRDGLIKENVSVSEFRAALALAKEYVQRQEALAAASNSTSSLQAKISALVQSNGLLSDENVLEHKREKKSIDYVALSLQMFGSLYDEDDVRMAEISTEDETDGKGGKINKKQRVEEVLSGDEDVDLDPYGLKLAGVGDEEYNSDDAKKRRKRKSVTSTSLHNGKRLKPAVAKEFDGDHVEKKKRGRPSLKEKHLKDKEDVTEKEGVIEKKRRGRPSLKNKVILSPERPPCHSLLLKEEEKSVCDFHDESGREEATTTTMNENDQ